ncbi:hypothetical protein [Pseudactinotalea suaedae]|uniref:hypothetical protein n=1 Tax=Pseudactinotalea suaedae TaxID=1524924 RepID=UPI0012E2E65F|nr:hypothetical protein [Pseudactinotalea suaedae]
MSSPRNSSQHPGAGADPEGAAVEHDAAAVVDPTPPTAPVDVVATATAAWRNRLGDLAGGSALWDVESLGDALVDLTAAHPNGIAQLFAGRSTRLSNLAREGSALTLARRRARIVGARTDELAQRYGFAPTYVAIGVASWPLPTADDGGSVPEGDAHAGAVNIPVLLRPVTITVHPADAEVDLELDPAVEINPVLIRALRSRGVDIDPADLVAVTQAAHGFTPAPALEALAEAARSAIDGFKLEPRIVLGAFVHPGQALAEDLDADRLRRHEVVAALAGSEADVRSLRRPLPARRLADPDPETERGVGDLDAGQHRVLDAVAGGGHLLVDAPPGVDVPGTVAALAAQAAAEGKRVLYVPGTKRAAASLHASLRALGLGDLVLDLGNDTRWRDAAAERLVDGLGIDPPELDPHIPVMRRELGEARAALSDYIHALHTARAPWDASAYLAMQELAELTSQRPGPRTQVRLDPQAVQMTLAERQHAREELARAAALGAFRLRASDTPWYGAVLTSAEHATETLARVRELGRVLPTVLAQVEATAAQTGLDEATTLRQWSEQLELLEGIRSSLDVFVPQVFERSATDMAAAAASHGWRERHGITLGRSDRRRLRKQAKDLLRPGVAVADLHAELLSVQARRELWRRHCAGGGWPRLPEGMTDILSTEHDVAALVDPLQSVLSPALGDVDLRDVPLTDLQSRLDRLVDDDATLRQMPERAGVLGVLKRLGLGPLVEDLTARRVPTDLVGPEFDLAWWSSLLEQLLRGDPALADLDASSLDVASMRLRELDAAQTSSLSAPVLVSVAEHVRASIAADKPAAQDFYRAVRGHGSTDLKELQRRFGPVVWAPRPIWIVPPMLVPQVLGPERTVDLVVLDAVQHLPTEQAIAAISRGRQVVIVGDTRRGGAGLVAAAHVLPSVELPGDRLDLDAEIAGFLAEHGYGDVIRPVPAPPRPPGIGLELVDGTGMPGPGAESVESVQSEVDRVVDLVIEHALTRPESSLAVIALNARHADRVREAVLSTAAGASMARFFDPSGPEPFTVVDIESVAGLRRDAVILTVGYGKTPHGRVLYRFGSISGQHGAELLVDALDACRHRLTVVSCLAPEDLDPERLRAAGAVALRDLLAFARAGVAARTATDDDDVPPDRLLRDLSERVERFGLTVVPRYGPVGGVRIPLAIGHPALPGELLLAVLTDDPDYVNESSLRRRDRHWVQRLENRGWRVRMVFSTAVFMDPQGEAAAIRDLVEQIVAERTGAAVPVRTAPAPPAVLDEEEDVEAERGPADDDDLDGAQPTAVPPTSEQPVVTDPPSGEGSTEAEASTQGGAETPDEAGTEGETNRSEMSAASTRRVQADERRAERRRGRHRLIEPGLFDRGEVLPG